MNDKKSKNLRQLSIQNRNVAIRLLLIAKSTRSIRIAAHDNSMFRYSNPFNAIFCSLQ